MTAYKAKTMSGAQRTVRSLLKQRERNASVLKMFAEQSQILRHERNELAKLAATRPAFFNPLAATEAKNIRDRVLRGLGMNSDGSFIK